MEKVRERLLSYHNRENVSLFLDITKELIEALDIDAEDKRFVCTVRNDHRKRISIDINKRLIGGLKTVGAAEHFIFMLYAKDVEALKAKGLKIAGRENAFADIKDSEETFAIDINREEFLLFKEEILEKWLVCCAEYLPRNSSSMYRKHHNADMFRMIVDESFREEELDSLYKNQFVEIDFFNQNDIDLILRHKGEKKEVDNKSHTETYAGLKHTYEKVAYWSNQVAKRAFTGAKSITRKRPTNQSNIFEYYLWSKIFPYPKQTKELAFTVSIEEDLFTIKIDTVGNVPFRAEYEDYRGEFGNSSNIVLQLEASEVLAMDWHTLFQTTASFIEQHMSDYDHILNKIVLKDQINYWLFQCNPSQYDIVSSLKANALDSWLVRSHKDSIKEGDKVILWVTGAQAGCYALAEILNKPTVRSESTHDTHWKVDSKEELRAGIMITHNLVNAPVLQSAIDTNPNLKKLKGGNQGTNFSASETEYNELIKLINMNKTTLPLNQILYGPPGTGKTYETKEIAVGIIDSQYLKSILHLSDEEKRKEVTKKYDEFYDNGQIVFTTFHQSMSYEDFVEGIKPISKGDKITYPVQVGIFKEMCEIAQATSINSIELEGTSQELDKSLFEKMYYDFSESLPDSENNTSDIRLRTSSGLEFQLFKNSANTVVVKAGEKRTHQSISFNQLAKVLFENKAPHYVSYERIIIEAILNGETIKSSATNNALKNFVLIIDEINRGNVSAIFGELITLLESDKRMGADEELKVQLPYSKDEEAFGVPPNLYIIGTMNTADRSVEALDTALRRRFTFKEVMPKPYLLDKIQFDNLNLGALLTTINERIEVLLDRDHTIGHSYFIKLKSNDKAGLKAVFKDNIIPLLQEYFYGDYEKIAWVLGKEFVEYIPKPDIQFPKFKGGNKPETSASYKIIDMDKDGFEIIKAVKELINPNGEAVVTDEK